MGAAGPVVLSLLLVIAACTQPSPPGGAPLAGPPLPELQAQGWINGPSSSRADLLGKVVVIDVWAWW